MNAPPRFDYIARDSHSVGDKGNLSLTRLIHSARVIDNQICYDIKDANQLYELCYTRFSLHKRIYNHKTGECHRSYKEKPPLNAHGQPRA